MLVLGARGQTGYVLGRSAGAAASPAWLAGGIDPANCIAAYQPIGAASLAASYVNLANPGTYDAAPGVAPTFASATGWTFNGVGLLTGIYPAAGMSIVIRADSITPSGAYTYLCGAVNNGEPYILCVRVRSGRSTSYLNGNSTAIFGAAERNTGIFAIAGQQGYYNGVADGGAIATDGVHAAGYSIGIGAASLLNSIYFPTNFTCQAIYIYNTTLSAAQNAEVAAAMAALT